MKIFQLLLLLAVTVLLCAAILPACGDDDDDDDDGGDDDGGQGNEFLCPDYDVTVYNNRPGENWNGKNPESGKYWALKVGKGDCFSDDCLHSHDYFTTLLYYNLDDAPAEFESASIKLFFTGLFGGISFKVRYLIITNSWDPDEVTWDTTPEGIDSGVRQTWSDDNWEPVFDVTDLIQQAREMGSEYKGFLIELNPDDDGLCYLGTCNIGLYPEEIDKDFCVRLTFQ